MTPEEHYISALMGMSRWEKREKVAAFRRSLVEHDTRVIEDFLYGSDACRLAALEWADGYKAGLGDGSSGIAVRYPGAAASDGEVLAAEEEAECSGLREEKG